MNTQFVRSRTDRRIAGVAGGLARALGVDSVFVRIGFIVLTLAWGGGLLLYAALWLLLPEEGSQSVIDRVINTHSDQPRFDPQTGQPITPERNNNLLGAIMIGIGVLMLAGYFHLTGPIIALALVAGGWYFLRSRRNTTIS